MDRIELSQKKFEEETRFNKGLEVQKSIFGEVIDQMHANAPENQKHIQNYLSAFCFGDIYTRGSLDLKTRELLTLCILSAWEDVKVRLITCFW